MWLVVFKFITTYLGTLKGVFGMVGKLPLAYIKTGLIWAVIALLSVGIFNYWSLIRENKSLIGQVATAVVEYNSCISNKEQLIVDIDNQNKAVLALETKLEVRGQVIESTKRRNADLLSTLATRLDNLYGDDKLEKCEDAMSWLVDTAVIK